MASIQADRQAFRELLRQSLDCCAVLPSGKLEVLEKDRLADLHKQADELRKRAGHNEDILDRFDAVHKEAVTVYPELEPTLFSLQAWKKTLLGRIQQGKNCIRTTAATWLASTEGSIYTPATIVDHPRVSREVAKYQPIIDAAEKELPIAAAHLEMAQVVLSEAILPAKWISFQPRTSSSRRSAGLLPSNLFFHGAKQLCQSDTVVLGCNPT